MIEKPINWTPFPSSNLTSQDIEYRISGASGWTLHLGSIAPTVNATNGTTVPHLSLETDTTYDVSILSHCKLGGPRRSNIYTFTTETGSNPVECLDGLTIETIYLHSNSDLALLPPEYTHPPNTNIIGNHSCNRALFEIFGNDIYVGESRLNNSSGTATGCVTPRGTAVCMDFNNKPAALTGGVWTGHPMSRYSVVTLNQAQALAIADASNNSNDITFTLVGAIDSYGCSCGGAQSHLDTTWIRIKRADGTVVYNGAPTKNIVTINVCASGG